MSDNAGGGKSGDKPNAAPEGETAEQTKYPFHKRFVRKPVEIRIEVERFQEAIASTSVNISPSGICFKLTDPLEPGERMRILLYIPRGKEVEILKVRGRQVWQDMYGDSYRVGAAFEQFAPGDERRLRAWLLDLGSPAK